MTVPMPDASAPAQPPDPPSDAPSSEAPTPPPIPGGEPPRYSLREFWASLRRDDETRLLGGVTGGLANALGVPRSLVIVAFALAAVPLVGFAVYALLWVLLPSTDGRRVADDSRWRDLIVAAVIVGVIYLFLALGVGPIRIRDWLPWALIVIGVAAVLRRVEPGRSRASATTLPPVPPTPPGTPTSQVPPFGAPDEASLLAAPSPPIPPVAAIPTPPRERRPLRFPAVGLFTWAVGLLVLALLGLAALGNRSLLGPGTMLAALTVVFGVGLLLSTFVGRARGLVLPALALCVGVLTLGALDIRADNVLGSYDATITSAADLPETITAGWGKSTIQLGGLELDEDRTLTIEQTAGVVWVALPVNSNATVDVTIKTGNAAVYSLGPTDDDLRTWAETEIPDASAPVSVERFGWVNDWVPQYSAQTISRGSKEFDTAGSFRLDNGANSTLHISISLEVGDVRILQPRWGYLPDSVGTPDQACTQPDTPGVVVRCSDVEDPQRQIPLCGNDYGYLVDCTTDRSGTPDWPLRPMCLDWSGVEQDCDYLGITVRNIERFPGDPTYTEPPAWATTTTTAAPATTAAPPTDAPVADPVPGAIEGSN